jgi:hypothetical protein
VAPLRLLFGSLEAPLNIWTSGFCFVQFQEYFLCNISETQKQQKIENWHCGVKTQKQQKIENWHLVNRLVPENA